MLTKTSFGAFNPDSVTHFDDKHDGSVVLHFAGGDTKHVPAADAPAIRKLLVEDDSEAADVAGDQ